MSLAAASWADIEVHSLFGNLYLRFFDNHCLSYRRLGVTYIFNWGYLALMTVRWNGVLGFGGGTGRTGAAGGASGGVVGFGGCAEDISGSFSFAFGSILMFPAGFGVLVF